MNRSIHRGGRAGAAVVVGVIRAKINPERI
jgi:hypothetical protein